MLLESLAQCDVILRRLNARYRVYVLAEIDSNGTDGRCISQTNSDRIRVVVGEVAQIDRAVCVSAIVENNASQRLHDSQRESHFRAEDEQLPPADWNSHVDTGTLSLQYIAKRNQALRPGLVDGEPSQRRSSTGEEQLAGWHEAAGERFCESQPDAVGEHARMNRFVVCVLAKKFRDVCPGGPGGPRNSKPKKFQY